MTRTREYRLAIKRSYSCSFSYTYLETPLRPMAARVTAWWLGKAGFNRVRPLENGSGRASTCLTNCRPLGIGASSDASAPWGPRNYRGDI